MRAAENRRWLLRSTNDGITVAIDPSGRIRARIPPFERATLDTSFSFVGQQTPYTRYGDWFPLLSGLVGIAALVAPQKRAAS